MICESGGYTGKYSIITVWDVEMVDTAKLSTRDTNIRWTDEQMDTITIATEDNMDKELVMEDDVEMAEPEQNTWYGGQ